MDRILILMASESFADARTALYSALENAKKPGRLSFGLTLLEEPDADENDLMAALGRVQFLCPADDAWAAMPQLWQGEGHVLMAHPAMRFTRGWDTSLMKQLRACYPRKPKAPPVVDRLRAWADPESAEALGEQMPIRKGGEEETASETPVQPVLTGYLPVRDDPLDAVCPVAADTLGATGELSFRHGVPLRYVTRSPRGPFLHPHFCFGPAGFFRAMAEAEEPMFLHAFREGWALYAPVSPVIRMVYTAQVPPVVLGAQSDLYDDFRETFGVDVPGVSLSPQSRRGMMNANVDFRLKVPAAVKLRHALSGWQQERQQQAGKVPAPQCVTMYTAQMPEETQRWLKRLAALQNLPLTAYVDPLKVREITEFLPNVRELKPRYLPEYPDALPEEVFALSKTALMVNARDRELAPSHTVWMDPDCVQYPLYGGTVFRWEEVCTDRIVMAMVDGRPDPTMFAVPEKLLLALAREFEARCLTCRSQRGAYPAEQDVWALLIREHPDWFQLIVMPVARQLFTLADAD